MQFCDPNGFVPALIRTSDIALCLQDLFVDAHRVANEDSGKHSP